MSERHRVKAFFYLYVLNSFIKLTRTILPDHDAVWRLIKYLKPIIVIGISNSIIDANMICWQILDTSLEIILSKYEFDIFYSLETLRFSVSLIFRQFLVVFSHNFLLNGKFQILMVSSEKSRLDLSDSATFWYFNIFFIYKNSLLGENHFFYNSLAV